jgi:hypothetical protein
MCKCHKETPCVAILKKISCFFLYFYIKSEDRKTKQVLPGVCGTSGRGEDVGKW